MDRCPNFWSVLAEALGLSASRRGFLAYVPWWLFICCALPIGVVFLVRSSLRPQITDGSIATVLSAIAVVAGFFGSVSVATIGQVQRMVAEYPFSSYLRDEKLFDQFLFWPQFTLLLQIALLLASAGMAALTRLFDCDYLNQYLIVVDVGLLIYVCTKTWKLVDLMRQLTWHYEQYNRLYKEYQSGKTEQA
ncbi:hypothetical protein [Bradyrhizobium canariense]|uniref:Uncharacterized protein n=1 Tax=Bradyrhizobium canariense TaxID=255045 RepID=A0A1H1NR79_9BRAD|nr:hypothetical protein [Bradyrhizobium canariense]SDS01524.1 hypothetical protein SAMN05444158_0730 [Bradyrhizobium canariense]